MYFGQDALLRQFQQEIEQLRKQLGDGGEGAIGDGDEDSEEEIVDPKTGERRMVKRKKGILVLLLVLVQVIGATEYSSEYSTVHVQ